MALTGLLPPSTLYIFSSNWWFYFNAILFYVMSKLSIVFYLQLNVKSVIPCFRNRQTPVSQSPAPTTTWSLSVLLSMSLLVPHLPLKSPASWMRVSWSAQSVGPPTPPAATGSSWHTLTTALPELEESEQFPACVSGPLLTEDGKAEKRHLCYTQFFFFLFLYNLSRPLKCFQIKITIWLTWSYWHAVCDNR